jgi:NAD(P)-dependent dehydrogenase (short-subunit alcohol dehydrogenase family)
VLFAAEGAAAVTLVYKAKEEDVDGELTVKEIQRVSKGKCRAKAIRTDLGHDDNCKQVVDTVIKEFGRIDVLVNNASSSSTRRTSRKSNRSNWSAPSAATSSPCSSSPATP